MKHFTDALFEGIYDPPYSADEVIANYGEETYNKLVQDPAHKWRMDTGIELIHKEPSKKELDRIWANWQLMDAESKKKSDQKSIELFGLTNAENYAKLCPLYESKSTGELQVNSPEELMDWMKSNITYELANDEYGAENDPPTKTAEEVIETKSGHCAEQSYLEKKILDDLGYETKLVFVKENNSEEDYGADGSAHLFLTYVDEDKICWFEHSMEHMRGIHKYDSEEDLLKDVAKNWWRYDSNSDALEVRFIPKPITGVDNWGLAQKCHKYPVEATFDISENILEQDALEESLENLVYKDISDLDHYKKSAKEILGGFGDLSDNNILDSNKEIYIDDKLVGYIGFDEYDDVEGYNKVLGFGNFMILERGKGYGTKVINDLVSRYKNEYDLIYCFVDAENSGAINLYKKLGKVYDEDGPNDNGQYYVTFWDKNEKTD